MNRSALGVLAVAIVLAMFVVVLVGDSGLSRQTERLAQTELAALNQTGSTFDGLVGRVEAALEAEPAFFKAGAYDQNWGAAIELGRARMEAANAAAAEVRALVEADDKEQEEEAKRQIDALNATRVAAVAAVEPAASEAARLLGFKQDLPAKLEQMTADYEAIQAADLRPIVDKVRQAQTDWPSKSDDLESRLARLTEVQPSAERWWEASEAARTAAASGEVGPAALVKLINDADALQRSRAGLAAAPPKLAELVDELYLSWDKILVDMEIQEGYEVAFRHQYKTVYTPVQQMAQETEQEPAAEPTQEPAQGMLDGTGLLTITLAGLLQDGTPPEVPQPEASEPEAQEDSAATDAEAGADPEIVPDDGPTIDNPEDAGVRTEERWEMVSKAEFERMKNNLGMVVAHKPAGSYDHEAESMTQPAGYQYVAPYGERNRYGYWNSGGFWVFYGQYAFMRDMFWGRGYRMGRNDWDDYSRHRSSGRTYYGNEGGRSRYGSTGSATKSRYSSSKYVRTDGFKNTQYVRSGGSYRGSRYASRSSGGSRSGGFSRSGGRSGGK